MYSAARTAPWRAAPQRPHPLVKIDFDAYSLPTDIQAEGIPMILGGGDVLMVSYYNA